MTALANRVAPLTRVMPAIAAVVGLVGLYLALTGSSSYVVNLRMANADGIRPGSQVTLGGVPVGTVHSLNVSGNTVIASLRIEKHGVHLGVGAHDSIVAANLLGEEYVALEPGDASHPLPSGTTLPESATTAPTDLDQITDVLNGGTRARLATLLSEVGTAADGREADIRALLRQIPLSMTDATVLLSQLTQSNGALSQAVARGDAFVSRIDAAAGNVKQAVDAASAAATTLAGRADSLRSSVEGAPQMLETLQTFFTKLGNTATTLKPTTIEISAAAPKLNALLTAVKPFTRSALPTLDKASSVGPTLTNLALKATPTVGDTLPTLGSLANIAKLAKPLSGWLGSSAPDLWDILSAWPNALQNRDGISHIFNGDVYLNPVVVVDIADLGASAAQKRANFKDILSNSVVQTVLKSGLKVPAGVTLPSVTPSKPATPPTTKPGSSVIGSLTTILKTAVPTLTHTSTDETPTTPESGVAGSVTTTSTKASSSLSSLLHYLVGK